MMNEKVEEKKLVLEEIEVTEMDILTDGNTPIIIGGAAINDRSYV